MKTKYNNHDSNVLKIVLQNVPQTSTLTKVESALSLIDASIKAITDDAIATALDSSSIQTLWATFNEYDFVTAAALSDLDSRLVSTDSSLEILGASTATKFVSLDSSLSGLSNAVSGLANDLSTHIAHCSGGGIDIDDTVIKDINSSIRNLNASVGTLKSQNNAIVSQLQDVSVGLKDVSLYLSTHIGNYNTLNNKVTDILTRLNQTSNNINNVSVNMSNQIARTNSNLTDVSLYVADISTRLNQSNNKVTDISSRLANHMSNSNAQMSVVCSSVNRLSNDVSTLQNSLNSTNNQVNEHWNVTARFISDYSPLIHEIDASLYRLTDIVETTIANDSAIINSLDASFLELYNEYKEFDIVTANALVALDASISYIATHTPKDVALASDVSTLRNDLNQHISECSNLNTKITNVSNNIADVSQRLNQTNTKVTDISTRLSNHIANYVSLSQTVTSHTSAISNINSHLTDIDDSIGYLRNERNRLNSSISSLTQYVNTEVRDIVQNDRARINSVESRAIDNTAAIADVSVSVSALRAQISQYRENNVATCSSVNALNASFIALSDSVNSSVNALNSSFVNLQTTLTNSNQSMSEEISQFKTQTNNVVSQLNQSYIANTSIMQKLETDFDDFDLVTARALAQLDASITQLFNLIQH